MALHRVAHGQQFLRIKRQALVSLEAALSLRNATSMKGNITHQRVNIVLLTPLLRQDQYQLLKVERLVFLKARNGNGLSPNTGVMIMWIQLTPIVRDIHGVQDGCLIIVTWNVDG